MYMTYPRLCALSEVVWTPRESRDYSDFKVSVVRCVSLLHSGGTALRRYM